MKVWVVKYALSGGIIEEEVEVCDGDTGMVRRAPPNHWNWLHKGDYCATREDALADAETKRVARIASLKKQIAKLEKLSFA